MATNTRRGSWGLAAWDWFALVKALFTLWLCLVLALTPPSSECSPGQGRAGRTGSPVHVATAETNPEAPVALSSANQMEASAQNLRDQISMAFEAGDYARAIELATQWIGRKPESADGYYLRGLVLGEGQQDYERAAADLARANRLAPDFAHAWVARGWYLILLGRWDEAREVTAKAQALAPDSYESSVNFGHTYLLQGDQETAHRWYGYSLPLIPDEESLLAGPVADFKLFVERGWNVAAAQEERGWLQQTWSEWQVVEALNQQVLDRHRNGQYQQAISLVRDQLRRTEILVGAKHPAFTGRLNKLAELLRATGRYGEAEPLYLRALELRKDMLGAKHPDTLTSMNNLSNLYASQGRYEAAEPLYVETLELRTDVLGAKHPDTLTSMNNLAALYESQGRYEAAEPLYIETLELRTDVLGAKHPDTLTSMNNLAVLYTFQERYEQAEAVSDEAISATQGFLTQVLWAAGEKTRASYIQQQMYQAYFYFSLFSHRATGDSARRALSLSLNRKALLLEIATQIRAVSRSVDDPVLKALASSLQDNRQRLAALILSGKADPSDIDALEKTVNQQQAKLGRQVQQLGPSSRPVSPEQVIEALETASVFVDVLVYRPPNTPPEKKRWQAEHLLALVVANQPKDAIRLVRLGALAPIRQAIEHYRTHLRRAQPLTAQAKVQGRQVYDALWAPLLPYLNGKQRVYLAPDGVLNLLPFASLIDDKGDYVIENYELIMLSSGRDLVLPPLRAKVTDPVVLAAPLYDSSQAEQYAKTQEQRQAVTAARDAGALYFTPLPGALKEGDTLTAQLVQKRQSPRYFKLAAATEPTVAEVQSPSILHLATHGFFLEDLPVLTADQNFWQHRGVNVIGQPASGLLPPAAGTGNPLLRSGLALVDANLAIAAANDEKPGILTAEEVLDLQLAGTRLVVLSACETGVGEIQTGEGVYGLRRAFQEAGAQAVLSTLWSISDEGTQHFMERFYERFLSGVLPQQALRETQLEFIQSENWRYPFYWAPFVMVGKE